MPLGILTIRIAATEHNSDESRAGERKADLNSVALVFAPRLNNIFCLPWASVGFRGLPELIVTGQALEHPAWTCSQMSKNSGKNRFSCFAGHRSPNVGGPVHHGFGEGERPLRTK